MREPAGVSEISHPRVDHLVEMFETGNAGGRLDTVYRSQVSTLTDNAQLNVNAGINASKDVNLSPKPEQLVDSKNQSLNTEGGEDHRRDSLRHCPGQSVSMK